MDGFENSASIGRRCDATWTAGDYYPEKSEYGKRSCFVLIHDFRVRLMLEIL